VSVSRETPSGDKGRRLGRGLEALLGRQTPATGASAIGSTGSTDSPLRDLAVADIRPNPFQPRTEFNADEIDELKESLAANGLLQPITVRPAGEGYELIAGERRLRAATALGWTHITCIVRAIDDQSALTLALVENLQRSDLNPIEEAEGYKRLASEFRLTQDEIARVVGKNRTTIANALRLLGLPERVRELVQQGSLSAGHGRAILGLNGDSAREAAAQTAVIEGLSVRDVEQYVRDIIAEGDSKADDSRDTGLKKTKYKNAELARIENSLRTYLQTDVRVEMFGPLSGDISIRFYGVDDCNRLLELMMGTEHTDEAR
jgi:ParB family transcriptional regulator, chromosome partitioning protein